MGLGNIYKRSVIARVFFLCIFCGIACFSGRIAASPSHYCQKYMEEAARKTGVLPEIIWAVAMKESSFGNGPWPWTINIRGKGYYFPDKATALHFLQSFDTKALAHVDVGCMQLNIGFHGNAFSSVSQMMDPRLNIIYGAYFLKELYHEQGKWAKAVANYHSRKWPRGGKYANGVARLIKLYQE